MHAVRGSSARSSSPAQAKTTTTAASPDSVEVTTRVVEGGHVPGRWQQDIDNPVGKLAILHLQTHHILILHADHEQNASTSTVRLVGSSGANPFACIAAGIASLWGPSHGGANEATLNMLEEIGDVSRIGEFINRAKDKTDSFRLMGFGHRVYKNGDTRVPYMTKYFHEMARLKGGEKWIEIENILEKTMVGKKNIHPNLDYPVGPAYYLMGFDIPVFTPIFVMSRITGWAAHVIEQLADNKLMRPLSVYTGVKQRAVAPIAQRKAA